MSDTNEPDIEDFIEAARAHGSVEDPEHEISDLQDLLRVAWGLMSESQREAFVESDEAQMVLDAGVGDAEDLDE
jgi:hypothetical protein